MLLAGVISVARHSWVSRSRGIVSENGRWWWWCVGGGGSRRSVALYTTQLENDALWQDWLNVRQDGKVTSN